MVDSVLQSVAIDEGHSVDMGRKRACRTHACHASADDDGVLHATALADAWRARRNGKTTSATASGSSTNGQWPSPSIT
jgi:cobalamin biosynthesis protein CobT